jgi:hypothetical protein
MGFFIFNWRHQVEALAIKAKEEQWSSRYYPYNGILSNYMFITYKRLIDENKVVFDENYALFNTGLFTKYYETIYAFDNGGDEVQYLTEYELGRYGVQQRPEKADYFQEPSKLIFDWHYPIDIQYRHILDNENNMNRLPIDFLQSNNKVSILNGAIDTMKKRVISNYRLAIPQYYKGEIQLLLPLCLMNDEVPDIAIAVSKHENRYQGHTCLTLEMAYNNARVITKPEVNWLKL